MKAFLQRYVKIAPAGNDADTLKVFLEFRRSIIGATHHNIPVEKMVGRGQRQQPSVSQVVRTLRSVAWSRHRPIASKLTYRFGVFTVSVDIRFSLILLC